MGLKSGGLLVGGALAMGAEGRYGIDAAWVHGAQRSSGTRPTRAAGRGVKGARVPGRCIGNVGALRVPDIQGSSTLGHQRLRPR